MGGHMVAICTGLILIVLAYIVYMLDNISNQIKRNRRTQMGATQDAVNEITAQLSKAKAEVLGKIGELEAQVAAGEVPDFTELRAAAQGLDDVVADAPVEPPVTEEPPVEEVPAAE